MSKLLLLDTATIYYRAYFSLPESITNAEGMPINAIRGTIDRIANLIKLTQPNQIVAAWDTEWRPQWRVDLIPTYKTHRIEETDGNEGGESTALPDNLAMQIPIIEEILNSLGIPVVGEENHEADDVIGTYSEQHIGEIEIVTGDRDLFQLINDKQKVSVRYTAKSEIKHLLEKDIYDMYGIAPNQYVDFSILRGDASDGLPGIKGIGEKTACYLINEFGNIDNVVAAAMKGDKRIKPRIQSNLMASADYIDKAKKVVPVVKNVDLTPINKLNFSMAPDGILEKMAIDLNVRASMLKIIAALRQIK